MKFPAHKAGLYLSHNEHKGVYESVEFFLKDQGFWEEGCASDSDQTAMINSDTIWMLQWYPRTPITSLRVVAPTMEKCLQYALEFEAEEAVKNG